MKSYRGTYRNLIGGIWGGSYREDKEDILFIYGQLVIARDLRGRIQGVSLVCQ